MPRQLAAGYLTYDVGAYLETLDMVEGMEAAVFVPVPFVPEK